MIVKIKISKELADVAIKHHLECNGKVNSRKEFIDTIKHYTILFGEMCVEDHKSELEHHSEESKRLIDKYYF